MSTTATAETILKLTESVKKDEANFGVFSLVLDRHDLLAEVNGGYTMLEAVNRLGDEWFRAAIVVQRALS